MKDELDVERLRAETPGCVVSNFFNHSGASLPSTRTLSAITNHLERESLYGGMEAATSVMPQVERIRRGLQEIVRASVSYLNSEVELDRLITATRALARGVIQGLPP